MIQSIQTSYNGHLFRSRLEARWAVFFDALRIRWEYEKEGYELEDGTLYLPDFYLPGLDCFIEIKGRNASKEEEKKAYLLAGGTGKTVYIFEGCLPKELELEDWACFSRGGNAYFPNEGFDHNYHFCVCNTCGKVGIEFEGRGDRICPGNKHSISGNLDKGYSHNHPKLKSAYKQANSARFER